MIKTKSRLLIVFALLFMALLSTVVFRSVLQETSDDRPNILFVITDDQSWIHTSFAGDNTVQTPNFDRVASEGFYFTRAYASAPSCTASRSAVLAGQHFWRLGSAGVLRGTFTSSIVSYQKILEDNEYNIGYTGKGWSPGIVEGENPVGQAYNRLTHDAAPANISNIDYSANFAQFLDQNEGDGPFSFWVSPYEPHRPYTRGEGVEQGIDINSITVPEFLPDNEIVRTDLADYYLEIQWQDAELGRILDELESRNLLENTIVVVTSDNGMPFPRAKSTNYQYGLQVPLAIRWGDVIKQHATIDFTVSLVDLAPTFLSAAGIEIPIEMTGRNLMPLIRNPEQFENSPQIESFEYTVAGFERHVPDAREENKSYPVRSIYSKDYLFIRNFYPDRWPAGTPPEFADIDGTSATKNEIYNHEDFLALATDKRPAEELYDLNADPFQLENIAFSAEYDGIKQELGRQLELKLENTDDPVLGSNPDSFSDYSFQPR